MPFEREISRRLLRAVQMMLVHWGVNEAIDEIE